MSRMTGIDSVLPSSPQPPDGYVSTADPLEDQPSHLSASDLSGEPDAAWENSDNRRRGPLRTPPRTVLLAVVLATAAAAGVVMIATSGDAPSSCYAARCTPSRSAFTYLSAASADLQPGGVAADATPGRASAFFSPPPVVDVSAPGRVVLSGPDAPDPFVLVAGSHEYMYTSERNPQRHERPGVHVAHRPSLGRSTRCAPPSACMGATGLHVGSRRPPRSRRMGALLHCSDQGCLPVDGVHRRRLRHESARPVQARTEALHLPGRPPRIDRPPHVRGRSGHPLDLLEVRRQRQPSDPMEDGKRLHGHICTAPQP